MLKTKKGFSLMEIIISITTLALISGFIIQMFLASNTLNLKAKNMDFGLNYATNIIEDFKSCKSISEFLEASENLETNGENYKIMRFFNNDWEELKRDINANFKIDIHIDLIEKADEEYNFETMTSELYKINVEVFNLKDSKSIMEFSSLKFFSL